MPWSTARKNGGRNKEMQREGNLEIAREYGERTMDEFTFGAYANAPTIRDARIE